MDKPVVRIGGQQPARAGSDPLDGLRRLGGSPPRSAGPRRHRMAPIAAVVGLALLTAGVVVISREGLVGIEIAGLDEGEVVNARSARELVVRVASTGLGGGDVHVAVNGQDVEVQSDEHGLLVKPAAVLREGPNLLTATVEGRWPIAGQSVQRSFVVHLSAPDLSVPAEVIARSEDPVTLRGMAPGAVSVEVGGQKVALSGAAFTVELPASSPGAVVRATDASGGWAEATVVVTRKPTPSPYPLTRAVRISAADWANPVSRQAVLELGARRLVNAIELDIKEEDGRLGYPSAVALAQQAGAGQAYYDPRAAVQQLHAAGLRVIGRVVCFRDPVVAGWAWRQGQRDLVVQKADGSAPLASGYGTAAFTNLANATVRQYLVDLSVEAARFGFDEILLDYVRRPEGPLASMRFPGLSGDAGVVVAQFVRDLRAALGPTKTRLGVSVFGIAATRPQEIAQDIALLAPNVDYVSPMVYPSHWGKGEYGVPDPVRMPGRIVTASVADFHRVVDGSGAAVVPWLQDFTYKGVPYGVPEVRGQIDAADAVGSPGFLLWNPSSTYHADALRPLPA